MTDTAWKSWERAVCKALGGHRDWQNPEECKGTGIFAAEAKYRKRIPEWLEKFMIQAERQARDDQLPLVALTERYRERRNALVIMRFGDFLDWFVVGPAQEDEDDNI